MMTLCDIYVYMTLSLFISMFMLTYLYFIIIITGTIIHFLLHFQLRDTGHTCLSR